MLDPSKTLPVSENVFIVELVFIQIFVNAPTEPAPFAGTDNTGKLERRVNEFANPYFIPPTLIT